MKRGVDWYKRDPIAFLDGVQGLGPENIGGYAVILDLLYARAGAMPRDDRHLSGILGCSIRKAAAITDTLLERGKIRFENGLITNTRVEDEASERRALNLHRVEAGRKGGETKTKRRRNDDETTVKPTRDDGETDAKRRRNDGENEVTSNENSHLGQAKRQAKPPREEKIREDVIASDEAITKPPAPPSVLARTDLLGAAIEPSGERRPMVEGTQIPDDFRLEAMHKANITDAEVELEWEVSFVRYWAENAGKKDGRKTHRGWKQAWLNYVTGDICQRRIASRRRNAGTPAMGKSAGGSAGVMDSLRECVDWGKNMDERGGQDPVDRDGAKPF